MIGIVAAILIILILYLFGTQAVHAETRAELKQYETDLLNLYSNIKSLDESIDDKNDEIRDKEIIIDEKKNELREKRKDANNNWDSFVDIQAAETEIQTAKNNYNTARNELFDLLRERSDKIKESKILVKIIESTVIDKVVFDTNNLVKKIGIVNSKTCIILNQNNINSTCPTYKDLIILDTSNTKISGKFTTDDNGYFHRSNDAINNSYRYYDFDDTLHLFVDPPSDMINRIKLIELRPNFDTYLDSENLSQDAEFELIDVIVNATYTKDTTKTIQVLNQTQSYQRILYHDRYIDNNCRLAIINADKWQLLLPDTINLMRHNCDDAYTSFNNKELIPINATYQDITTSQKYKDDKRLQYIKEFCIFKFQTCKG